MRRFSSEGSLLDLDAFPWRRMGHKTAEQGQEGCSVAETYTPHLEEPESSMEAPTPAMSSRGRGRKLKKELSVSVENITELDKAAGNLQSSSLNESYRAYSDSQLAPDPKGSRDSVGPDRPPSPSSSRCNPLPTMSTHSNQARARLSAAKVHLKSLFSVTSIVSVWVYVCVCQCEHHLLSLIAFSITTSFSCQPYVCPQLCENTNWNIWPTQHFLWTKQDDQIYMAPFIRL